MTENKTSSEIYTSLSQNIKRWGADLGFQKVGISDINLDEADPACDLDYVPNKGVEGEINVAMSNSLGFGGHNASVLIKKFQK